MAEKQGTRCKRNPRRINRGLCLTNLLLWGSLAAPLLTLRLFRAPIQPTPVPKSAPALLARTQGRVLDQWNPNVSANVADGDFLHCPSHGSNYIYCALGRMPLIPNWHTAIICSKGSMRKGHITWNATQVWERLWLGGLADAEELAACNPHGITTVVSLSEIPVERKSRDINYVHLPIEDAEPLPVAQLDRILKALSENIRCGTVLLHCSQGVSRAPSLAAAYMDAVGCKGMDVWRHRSGSSAGSRNEQRWQGHSSGSIRVMETVGLAPSGEL